MIALISGSQSFGATLPIQVQVNSDSVLDWLTGALAFVTTIMAGATVYLGRKTRRSVAASEAEADATLQLVKEARRDRELAVQPVLVKRGGGDIGAVGGQRIPLLQVTNIGRGPALSVRLLYWDSGEVFWNQLRFPIGSGETYPVGNELPLSEHRGAAAVEPSLVSPNPPDKLCAYCFDQLGNGLKLRLGGAAPPEVWHRNEARPPWANALEETFDWRPEGVREQPKA